MSPEQKTLVQETWRQVVPTADTDVHCEIVGAAFLWTLENGLGEHWIADVKTAWSAAYTLIADIMRPATAIAA